MTQAYLDPIGQDPIEMVGLHLFGGTGHARAAMYIWQNAQG